MKKTKKKWLVSGWASMSVNAEVEAATEEEAKELFLGLSAPSLCHQCSDKGGEDGETFQLNGWDDNLNVTEIEKL